MIFNGHFRNLKKAYVREYRNKIWPYMVQNLHFRILKFPLMIGGKPLQILDSTCPPEVWGMLVVASAGSYRCSTGVFMISMVPIAALRHALAFPGEKN